jgi:IPT/TIG domain
MTARRRRRAKTQPRPSSLGLQSAPPAAPSATRIRGGVDIRDAHNGQLRLPIYLPELFVMLNTDIDGLHDGFLTVDEKGQRLFALTTSGLTVVQLAAVPLGIGTLTPANGAAAGGTSVTLTGSGFQSATTATLGGKALALTFKDMNTLTFTSPALTSGAQQLVLTNPDGETVSLDDAFLANNSSNFFLNSSSNTRVFTLPFSTRSSTQATQGNTQI